MTDRLTTELQRLYRLQDTALTSTTDQTLVAAWVMELPQRLGWAKAIALWQTIQQEWDFPAPAIAVNGLDAYQLWLSLERPTAWASIQGWQHKLLQGHCTAQERASVRSWPLPHPAAAIPQPAPNGCWSAFIAPDLLGLFADEAGLDIPPSADAQADLLCRLRPIPWTDWQRAQATVVQTDNPQSTSTMASVPSSSSSAAVNANTCPHHEEARAFLRQVMHNPEVGWEWRIEAAKVLLRSGG